MNNLASKNIFWTLLNLFLALAIVLGLQILFSKTLTNDISTRTITVSGEGKTVVAPDIATVSFSVVTQGTDPEVIQSQNTKKVNDAIDFIKSQGIKKEDIKTANYNLSPRYDYGSRTIFPPQPPNIIGYTLTQTVFVKVRDLEKVAPILGGLPSRGINQIEQVSFDVENDDQYLSSARDQAFKEAREKAEAMAKSNKVRIRRVVTFSESLGGYPRPYFLETKALSAGSSDAPPPTIEPGSQEVTVQVSVTYEIR